MQARILTISSRMTAWRLPSDLPSSSPYPVVHQGFIDIEGITPREQAKRQRIVAIVYRGIARYAADGEIVLCPDDGSSDPPTEHMGGPAREPAARPEWMESADRESRIAGRLPVSTFFEKQGQIWKGEARARVGNDFRDYRFQPAGFSPVV